MDGFASWQRESSGVIPRCVVKQLGGVAIY